MTGADSATVTTVAEELATQMRRIPLISDVISQTSLERPELRIRPRTDMLARLASPPRGCPDDPGGHDRRRGPALARSDAGDGDTDPRTADERARTNLQIIEQLRVPMGRGGGVPLGVIADISLDQGPTNIDRFDRNRRAVLTADLAGEPPSRTR